MYYLTVYQNYRTYACDHQVSLNRAVGYRSRYGNIFARYNKDNSRHVQKYVLNQCRLVGYGVLSVFLFHSGTFQTYSIFFHTLKKTANFYYYHHNSVSWAKGIGIPVFFPLEVPQKNQRQIRYF